MTVAAATARIRPYQRSDEPAVLALMDSALGWPANERSRRFLRWKHEQGPWGTSPAWVALAGDRLVGFRAFMRWRFDTPAGAVDAVRAVDTATAPEARGQGVFRRLTLHGLDEMTRLGVSFVFNTPNDQSRPGYLKMGWHLLGRLPARVVLPGAGALPRLARARTAAELWSLEAGAGLPAASALADTDGVRALLDSQPPASGLRTARSPGFLAWRFGFPPLHYRALLHGDSPADGLLVFRLRRRGAAVEAVVAELLAPEGSPAVARALLRRLRRVSGADYLLALGSADHPVRVGVPLPGQGPQLAWRGLCTPRPGPLEDYRLTLGDVELF